ncbi:hypothetical protein [Krasilnikovia sp. MM14-A1259]|uniref:hypothetical protein n=1 Tax=Krasilnikovia sp. MM14-A1259 TaxID=3373539 RepID=UPI00399D0414
MIRHLLTAMITVLVVMAAWGVLSAPFVGVFIIDGGFSATEYAGAALQVAGYVCVAALAITPVAVGLERLVLHGSRVWTVLAALLPFALFAAMVAGVVAMFKLTDSRGAYLAIALAVFLMFVLVIYWPMLWLLNLASYVLRRVRWSARAHSLHVDAVSVGRPGF